MIRFPDEPLPDLRTWELYYDLNYIEVWRKPAEVLSYFDVATAASITSAARAVLLDALCKATNVFYCDTDSIICERLDDVELHATKLGAWDCEAELDKIAIGGKKLYAGWLNGKCVKKANKGCKISADDILKISNGGTVEWKSEAPTFSLEKGISYTTRSITNSLTTVK